MKVSITTLGCKSNQYDSSALEDVLREGSVDIVPFPGPANAYIINTCTVTENTDCQSRRIIRKVRKNNPDAVIIVTGCYAQVASDEVSRIEGVDYVMGNPDKGKVLEFIFKGRPERAQTVVSDYKAGTPFTLRARSSSGRARANLKVQEGCNRSCSYCIIPKARGASKSLPIGEVERELDALSENGFSEVVLTGIHLGAYGDDQQSGLSIVSILKLIEKKDYPCRFRISSLDPDEVTDELIDVLKSAKRICNHLHLPLQSGDDSIIRRMRRPYSPALFSERVLKLHGAVRDISIGVDVIAGFPGEGEIEFENTYSLLKRLPVSYLHVFPFSKRRGTPAADYNGQVSPNDIKERCLRLKALDNEKRAEFHKSQIGKRAEIAVEAAKDKETGLLKGRSSNYIPVLFEGEDALRKRLVEVELTGLTAGAMSARLKKPEKT